jgi:hypothetical protein
VQARRLKAPNCHKFGTVFLVSKYTDSYGFQARSHLLQ